MSINKVIRLGKRSTESDAKPRPVKLKLASEEQKHKLLKQTKKNWTKYKEGAFENVFIHQDLTPNQRKKTARTCEAIKKRQSNGERNLMIANWKIITL